MSSADTRALITQAVERFGKEVPALQKLALVIRLELRARGDSPTWRVEIPGPKISRDPAGDSRLDLTINREDFNKLAAEGTLRDWKKAYDAGHVNVSGEPAIVKLLANVIERQAQRSTR